MGWVWMLITALIWLGSPGWGQTQAGVLSDRVAAFPDWSHKPPVERAVGDLTYPDWFMGTWRVKSTLVDLAAPLAPEIVTPGFESNRSQLHQPIEFQVRFGDPPDFPATSALEPTQKSQASDLSDLPDVIVADRAFNGLNIARAYLGDRTVLSVKVDPHSPNQQITFLKDDLSLASTITGRASERPDPDRFVTSELFQQVFRGTVQPYLNQVETTTAYHRSATPPVIQATQVTAIYLSPQDRQYFQAQESPVALYKYHLEFTPLSPAAAP